MAHLHWACRYHVCRLKEPRLTTAMQVQQEFALPTRCRCRNIQSREISTGLLGPHLLLAGLPSRLARVFARIACRPAACLAPLSRSCRIIAAVAEPCEPALESTDSAAAAPAAAAACVAVASAAAASAAAASSVAVASASDAAAVSTSDSDSASDSGCDAGPASAALPAAAAVRSAAAAEASPSPSATGGTAGGAAGL